MIEVGRGVVGPVLPRRLRSRGRLGLKSGFESPSTVTACNLLHNHPTKTRAEWGAACRDYARRLGGWGSRRVTRAPMHHVPGANFLDVQIWCPLRFYVEFYSWRNIGDTSVAVVTIPFYRVSNEM